MVCKTSVAVINYHSVKRLVALIRCRGGPIHSFSLHIRLALLKSYNSDTPTQQAGGLDGSVGMDHDSYDGRPRQMIILNFAWSR